MCGRFSFTMDTEELQEAFPWVDFGPVVHQRYNIAPSQNVHVVPNDGEKKAQMFRWGLIPSWAKDPKIGYRMINARSETLAEKPSFRNAYRKQRCLVPASGFYEWKKEGKAKAPFYIRMKSTKPFAFAGLWERWQNPARETIFSFAIITTAANKLLDPIHQRMPAILQPKDYEFWLDSNNQADVELKKLLLPFPSDEMEAYRVSSLVNSPKNDSPDCLKPMIS